MNAMAEIRPGSVWRAWSCVLNW